MKKIVLAFCIAISAFMCHLMPVSAGEPVCPGSPDKAHHFSAHSSTGVGGTEEGGTHRYIYGYDHSGNPIYRSDCKITRTYYYCRFVCMYCGTRESNVEHKHITQTIHSIDHK